MSFTNPHKRSSIFSRHPSKFARRSMDRIRRSFRDSFRRRGSKDRGLSQSGSGGNGSDPSKPQQWQQDEASVRAGTCNFFVKYLGCVEVYESRGMQVCEEALKVLRAQRRRPVKGVLYVSGDGLRVVDAENKGLIVDQTIEKVSFCAPDRSHEKGFAYICRDGTTRRWMCHGFHAVKETGERLSHAVGCAFAVCLEKKQKRDRESANAALANSIPPGIPAATSAPSISNVSTQNGGPGNSASTDNFNRQGSFRPASLKERLQDPQNVKIAEPLPPTKEPIAAPVAAVPRPAPNLELFQRQGSLKMPAQSFKRQYSLRIGELPSTLNRQQEAGGIPGARVSAIPEETTPEGYSTICQELTDNLRNMDLAARQNMMNNQNQPPSPTTSLNSARSRADEWLESTLMRSSLTNGAPVSNNPAGPSPPLPQEPPQMDVFGQPKFVPPIPPRNPGLSLKTKSQSLDTTQPSSSYRNSAATRPSPVIEDPFEAKWNALGPIEKKETNPFKAESGGVNI